MIALSAAKLFTPIDCIDAPLVLLEGSSIAEVRSRREGELPAGIRHVDFGGSILVPGFVDLHIHGAGGHDVMEDDPLALRAVETLIARHGVTGYFPTTVSAPLDATLTALERLANAIEGHDDAADQRARPLGIHLEGPFISHARRGVHPPGDLLAPKLETFERFWQAARGQIRVMTIAPELPGAVEVIAEAARRGVCVSVGHSDADLAATRAAAAAGARHATHTFNAMRPLGHRDPGILGEVLTDDRFTADIIADGIHLDPVVVRLFLQAKGGERAVLITDAIAATGMPDGRYRLGSFEVEVKGGTCSRDGKLAGSVLTMDQAIRNVMQFADLRLAEVLPMATRNPAKVAGVAGAGRLEPGARADFVVLSPSGDVQATIIGGNVE